MIVSEWSKLNDLSGSILEYVDIVRDNFEVNIGEKFETRFVSGIVTKEIANEIVNYQYSKENEGYFKAELVDNRLKVTFLKRCF